MKKPKINYLIAVITTDGRIGYYDGTGFDTEKSKARLYKSKGIAVIQAQKVHDLKGVKFASVFMSGFTPNTIETKLRSIKRRVIKKRVVKKRVVKKKNPIAGSKQRRIKKASNLYENFTGHEADEVIEVTLPQHDTGLKVGRCLGIMYETTRDGKKESYLHEFKRSSQPDFCISHDGQQIYLIGGNYLFKDSGINDI